MTMLVVWAAVLLTYGVSAGNAMKIAEAGVVAGALAGAVAGAVVGAVAGAVVGAVAGAVVGALFGAAVGAVVGAAVGALPVAGPGPEANCYLPLDMAPNSVDDMYSSCNREMLEKAPEYLQREKNENSKFKEVWDTMMVNNSRRLRQALTLSTEQLVAIKVYTADSKKLYKDFNDAVRSQKSQYKTSFGFHALHFYLTSAIQALKAQSEDKGCLTVYRRVNEYFNQDVDDKEIRFGSFTSSSWGQYIDDVFGDKSCFEIYTCMGANISEYSTIPDQREVLIPPYEVFKVVGIEKRSQQPDLPCEVEYKLQSTGTPVSNLNCALFK